MTHDTSAPAPRRVLNKVPQVTAAFWVIKVLSTTVGETAADFLNGQLGLGLTATTLVMAVLLATALVVQFRAKRYIPAVYWVAVVLISIVGTLITDNLTDGIGVPLWISTTVFAVILAVVFGVWFSVERTLSIHSIVTTRREAFYWGAVLFTFALGTALGDFLGEALNLGYPLALGLFAAAILVVGLVYRFAHLGAVVAFWIAYVLTRPLEASLGDLLSQPVKDGGLGLGTTWTSAAFLIAIVALVIVLTVRERRSGLPDSADAVAG